MHPLPAFISSGPTRIRPRTALVASADENFRRRLAEVLTGLRWQVCEAGGGAEAWYAAEASTPEALILDSWLPDLDREEFVKEFQGSFPHVDLLAADGIPGNGTPRSPHRQELFYALRSSQDTDTAAWNAAPPLDPPAPAMKPSDARPANLLPGGPAARSGAPVDRLPGLVGNAPCMAEISRRVRLVAPRNTPVLIEALERKSLPRPFIAFLRASGSLSWPSTAPPFPRRCSKPNSSATLAAHSPGPCRAA